MNQFLNTLSSYVSDIVAKHQLPAMSVAVWQNGEQYQAATGVLNVETGVEATVDSVFQIGSITKVFTSVLVMQLVDQGRLDLDKPVQFYLRDFSVACPLASQQITPRHLLSHTSGMEGDFFAADKPSGGNALARYIDRCELLPQIASSGDYFSYANSAFCILGRLLEVVTGVRWADLIQERIVEPLGLSHALVNPSDASLFRVARGHIQAAADKPNWEVSRRVFPVGMAPIGTTLAMSASDLVRFGLPFLQQGRQSGDEGWLSASSVNAMQQPQVGLPEYGQHFFTDWGLGWGLVKDRGPLVIGHDGGTIGQCALLRVIPEHNTVFAVLLNSDSFFDVLGEVLRDFMQGLCAIDYPNPEPEASDIDLDKYCGQYQSLGQEYTVFSKGDTLYCDTVIKTSGEEFEPWILKPINQQCFAAYLPSGERRFNIHFLFSPESKLPEYLFSFHRLNRRLP